MPGEQNIGKFVSGLLIYRTAGDGAGNLAVTFGTHTTVAADDDDIATGLSEVLYCMANFNEDIVAGATMVQSLLAGVAGAINIKTWEQDGTAATTFGLDINWMAVGRI